MSGYTEATIPDIGLNFPNSYEVLIPKVPGTYRITDRIFAPDSTIADPTPSAGPPTTTISNRSVVIIT